MARLPHHPRPGAGSTACPWQGVTSACQMAQPAIKGAGEAGLQTQLQEEAASPALPCTVRRGGTGGWSRLKACDADRLEWHKAAASSPDLGFTSVAWRPGMLCGTSCACSETN